ncbi:MAG: ATP-binding protein [Lentisphaerae bacterium]|jgi:uncharacterized protein|nr:ATP-binding protein [Lentisphaerota bacterium]MBT4816002.1 ATP-binding protein [Lentisphaerota bacterium]MBT5604525.1 ATP-binding protein [Lentisphaerota bacterium]MBT7061920.1 ATP-binding protein [Lentisphaerota bacterium]MBT7847920.1 ATP-binding protein [Lentisphaerota bacterium]
MYNRKLNLDICEEESCFLWGPRQTGKSTLLRLCFPDARRYDLLLSTEYRRLIAHPGLVREECEAAGLTGETQQNPVIIDEIQKVPDLLDEVHWLIENRGLRFILCGSSARKVRRGHANLLGGRAVRCELFPLTSAEVPELDLSKALSDGLLPRHLQSRSATRLIRAYLGDYLREEIAAEALVRNVPAFSRFLEVAALSNGELVNYANIARECAVSAPTARQYFEILEDTLLGAMLPAFRKRAKRRTIGAPKFFLFDVGIAGHLARRGPVQQGSELFGKAFEHFLFMELRAHASYSGTCYPISYWRTAAGAEVDFILDDGRVAIEVKSSEMVRGRHLRGLRMFREEHRPDRSMVVSLDSRPRITADGIEILPWRDFLGRLWAGDIVPTP